MHRLLSAIAILVVVGVVVLLTSGSIAARRSGSYVDPGRRFSIELPPGVVVGDWPSSIAPIDTLVFDRGSNDNVQITIAPWSGADALTKEALLHDYPSLADVTIAPTVVAGADGVTFEQPNADARDVWFAHGGYLYQVVGYGKGATMLPVMVGTWKFF